MHRKRISVPAALTAALLIIASPALAENDRIWRKALPEHGLNDPDLYGARYDSSGLSAVESATITLTDPYGYPKNLYSIHLSEYGNEKLLDFINSDEGRFLRQTLDLECPPLFAGTPMAYSHSLGLECTRRVIRGDNRAELRFVLDANDIRPNDGFASIVGFGVAINKDGPYTELVSLAPGEYCSGDEETGMCVSCVSHITNIASGEEPSVCGVDDEYRNHAFVTVNLSWNTLAEGLDKMGYIAARTQSQPRISLMAKMRSGELVQIKYATDNLERALFDLP